MNLYCIKLLMFTKNNNIKVKRKADEKINLHSHCIDFSYKQFATIDKEELSKLLKNLI